MTIIRNLVLVLALLTGALLAGWGVGSLLTPQPRGPEISSHDLDHLERAGLRLSDTPLLITLSTCPACAETRTWLVEQGVAFEELPVDRSEDDRALVERLGFRAVPVLIVGDRHVVGFHPSPMRELLAGKRRLSM
jgi:glutaredoxin